MGITKRTVFFRILATILILLVTVSLTLAAHASVRKSEEKHCWEVLGDSARSISREIGIRMEDNRSILELAAGALAQGDYLGSPEEIIELVNEYLDMTMFSRIDILYPDNTILLSTGRTVKGGSDISFDSIAENGTYVSNRVTDFQTGRETVFYNVPVTVNGEPIAILVGAIDCLELADYFHPTIYDGEAMCLMVDRTDGSIIMDSVYSELGNLFDFPDIKGLKDYEDADLINGVTSAQSGVIAYKSPRSGENTYMYYTPVEGYNWELLVFVEESLAFSRHDSLHSSIATVAIIESVVILIFVVMNLLSINQIAKSKAEAEQQLHKSSILIECVTELSSYSNIDTSIRRLLAIVNRHFDGDRTYLCDVDYDAQTTSNLYEYAIEGVTEEINNLQNVPLSAVDAWLEEFRRSGIFYISDLDKDVNSDSNTYRILAAQGIHSLIAVPLLRGDTIIGYLGVDNPKENCNDLTLLSSVQFFVTEALERKASQDALTQMSFTDTLTRMHNRNKFNYVCDELTRHPRNRVGVAFFDLDGLKQVNDQQGHDAGDRLIINTADNIRSMFSGNSYRVGGDEFAVILPDVDQNEFDIQVDKVRNLMKKNNISVAIGVSWHEDSPNIRSQLKEADERMYAEKAEHRRLRAEAHAEALKEQNTTCQ